MKPYSMQDFDTDILIVGAGPTGLTLAASLAQKGIRATLFDAQAEGANTSRAAVIHAKTLEALRPLCITDSLVAKGMPVQRFTIRDRDRVLLPIDFDQLPTEFNYALMLSQAVTERVLVEKLKAMNVPLVRPRKLTGFSQDKDSVTAQFDDGSQCRARFLVGADGVHSKVREIAGIAFEGSRYRESFILADVRLDGGIPSDEVILYFSPAGMVVVAPLPGGARRVVATVDEAPECPDKQWLQALLDARGPADNPARVAAVIWSSRFRVHHRLANKYRAGRVLIAGDAAHVHSPAGGQGMNAGILDAIALAEVLQQALAGNLAALDDYGRTRRPVAQQILALSQRLTRVATVRNTGKFARNFLLLIFSLLPPLRHRLALQLSGLIYR
jgi:2-polyprenyl-6-methoxyphenol hydroxylase-like FAD-dependent oxidoreductase